MDLLFSELGCISIWQAVTDWTSAHLWAADQGCGHPSALWTLWTAYQLLAVSWIWRMGGCVLWLLITIAVLCFGMYVHRMGAGITKDTHHVQHALLGTAVRIVCCCVVHSNTICIGSVFMSVHGPVEFWNCCSISRGFVTKFKDW